MVGPTCSLPFPRTAHHVKSRDVRGYGQPQASKRAEPRGGGGGRGIHSLRVSYSFLVLCQQRESRWPIGDSATCWQLPQRRQHLTLASSVTDRHIGMEEASISRNPTPILLRAFSLLIFYFVQERHTDSYLLAKIKASRRSAFIRTSSRRRLNSIPGSDPV